MSSEAGKRSNSTSCLSTFPPSAGPLERARDHGLLIGKDGLYGNVLRLSPMLNSSKADVYEGARLLDKSFSEAR
jgi:4-aminobutyrate aminotransferase-like enzyme